MNVNEAIELARQACIDKMSESWFKFHDARTSPDPLIAQEHAHDVEQYQQAADTLRTLAETVEAMAGAIQALIDESWNYTDDMGGITCTCCSGVGMVDVEIEHDPDCPVRLARQARAKWSGEN